MNQTFSDKRTEKVKLSKINNDLKANRKVAQIKGPKPVKKVVKKATKTKGPPKSSHLRRWASSLADPFDSPQSICPVNFNPAPSTMNTTARLTHTDLNLVVSANQTRQITIFPHGEPVRSSQLVSAGLSVGSDMDAVAYHSGTCSNLVTAGSNTVLSAFNALNDNGSIAFTGALCLDNVVGIGACTNGVPTSSLVRTFDSALPYSGAGSYATHLRFQVVSIGVRVYNTTVQLSRGGNVATCQPINQGGFIRADGVGASNQRELEINPTYRVHGDCGEGVEISWIPRMQDLAYWHPVVPRNGTAADNFAATGLGGAGIGIFLNNTTANTQSYTLEIVWNIMLAGTSVQAISSESVNEPMLRSPVEQTITHLANTASTARVAPIVASAASGSIHEDQSMKEKLSSMGYDAAMRLAHTAGAAAGYAMNAYSSYGHARYGNALAPRRH